MREGEHWVDLSRGPPPYEPDPGFLERYVHCLNGHSERRPQIFISNLWKWLNHLLYHQIGNINFFIFIGQISKTLSCVDKIKYEHLTILSILKCCQCAPKIVLWLMIFEYVANLRICRLFCLKVIPMSHRNI